MEKLIACTKLDKEDYDELAKIAKKERRTRSHLLRLIVNDYLHNKDLKNALMKKIKDEDTAWKKAKT